MGGEGLHVKRTDNLTLLSLSTRLIVTKMTHMECIAQFTGSQHATITLNNFHANTA